MLLPPPTAPNPLLERSGVIPTSSLEDSRPSPSPAVRENHAALHEKNSPKATYHQAAAELRSRSRP